MCLYSCVHTAIVKATSFSKYISLFDCAITVHVSNYTEDDDVDDDNFSDAVSTFDATSKILVNAQTAS